MLVGMANQERKETIMNRKKTLPIVGATVALGLLLGATVFGPGSATAQESATETVAEDEERTGRLREALETLVEDGTITAAQADAVAERLASTLPGRHGHFIGRGPGLASFEAAAEIIGIENSELREALADGATLAEVAEDNGVAVDTLIAGLVSALDEKLDELVADGRITEEQAAEIRDNAPERIEDFVNSEVRIRRGFWLTPPIEDEPGA
jgi:polyhydroxyalkanoate synthesis regulator phasin